MSVILNVAPDGATIAPLAPCTALIVISTKTQFLDHVEINSTSQLVNGICKLLQKLLECFSGITTFMFVNESLSYRAFPAILVLYLKDSELEERRSRVSSL